MKDQASSPSQDCSEVKQILTELVALNWLAREKEERRRLVIASLESLLDLPVSGAVAASGPTKRGCPAGSAILKTTDTDSDPPNRQKLAPSPPCP
jgi:hypothetical protein